MAKKIYDIMPPKEEPKLIAKPEKNSGVLAIKVVKDPVIKTKAVFASNVVTENIKPEIVTELSPVPSQDFAYNKSENKEPEKLPAMPIKTRKKFDFSFKKALLISCGVFVVMLVGYLYFSLQKAEVAIWPKTELLSANSKITTDKSVTTIDLVNKKIPVEVFQVEKDLWQDFPATGNTQNSGKASGTIKIYNKLNPVSAFTLKTGTHFLSDSGKYFVTSASVTIPAGTLKSGKLTPGSISVKVTAEEAGKDYNIESSKFSIPKLVGTNYYYSIYAESTGSMAGGFASDVKQVTQADLNNAKSELSKKVLSQAELSLREKISSDYVLFDNAISSNVTETFSPVKVGATVDNFSYQVKVKAEALAFKRQDIEKFAKDNLITLASGKIILDKSFKLDFNTDLVNVANGNMTLNSDFSSKVYQAIDTNDLVTLLMQKSKIEVKDIITSRLVNQVERLDVKFWPFWTQKVPTNKEKISVELKFE
jgi:hypothetical protein